MARFLVVMNLHDTSPRRLEITIPAVKSALENNSDKGIELAFRSAHGDMFGYCIMSEKPAAHILRAIGTVTYHDGYLKNAPVIDGRDSLMIFEIGGDIAARGFTRLETWLQRHNG